MVATTGSIYIGVPFTGSFYCEINRNQLYTGRIKQIYIYFAGRIKILFLENKRKQLILNMLVSKSTTGNLIVKYFLPSLKRLTLQ